MPILILVAYPVRQQMAAVYLQLLRIQQVVVINRLVGVAEIVILGGRCDDVGVEGLRVVDRMALW